MSKDVLFIYVFSFNFMFWVGDFELPSLNCQSYICCYSHGGRDAVFVQMNAFILREVRCFLKMQIKAWWGIRGESQKSTKHCSAESLPGLEHEPPLGTAHCISKSTFTLLTKLLRIIHMPGKNYSTTLNLSFFLSFSPSYFCFFFWFNALYCIFSIHFLLSTNLFECP